MVIISYGNTATIYTHKQELIKVVRSPKKERPKKQQPDTSCMLLSQSWYKMGLLLENSAGISKSLRQKSEILQNIQPFLLILLVGDQFFTFQIIQGLKPLFNRLLGDIAGLGT